MPEIESVCGYLVFDHKHPLDNSSFKWSDSDSVHIPVPQLMSSRSEQQYSPNRADTGVGRGIHQDCEGVVLEVGVLPPS